MTPTPEEIAPQHAHVLIGGEGRGDMSAMTFTTDEQLKFNIKQMVFGGEFLGDQESEAEDIFKTVRRGDRYEFECGYIEAIRISYNPPLTPAKPAEGGGEMDSFKYTLPNGFEISILTTKAEFDAAHKCPGTIETIAAQAYRHGTQAPPEKPETGAVPKYSGLVNDDLMRVAETVALKKAVMEKFFTGHNLSHMNEQREAKRMLECVDFIFESNLLKSPGVSVGEVVAALDETNKYLEVMTDTNLLPTMTLHNEFLRLQKQNRTALQPFLKGG